MFAPLLFAIALAGDWTGTSTCTNLKALPACHDEVVVYRFTEKSEKLLHLVAFKIIDGKEDYMGEFDVTRNGSRLTNEMVDKQGRRAIWDFNVDGDKIDGTLTMQPSGDVVRKIAVKKR